MLGFGFLLLCWSWPYFVVLPGLPEKTRRKEEWQLEECQEQIAHEYDKLYGRKGTQPLLAAPWQRVVEVKFQDDKSF